MLSLTIDDKPVQVEPGSTILQAAQRAEVYIPTLCHHPDLKCSGGRKADAFTFHGQEKLTHQQGEAVTEGCGICLVAVEGADELQKACGTEAAEGMAVTTLSDRIKAERKKNFIPVMARHPHACLLCKQQTGCDLLQCSQNVPLEERCCSLFGRCELQNVANFIGIDGSTPRWVPTNLPYIKDEPLFERNYSLCIGCLRCVRACNELREVGALGFVIDEEGRVQVGTVAPTLRESDCRFCTACVEVCPTGTLIDKKVRAGHEEEDLVTCRAACPTHVDVPGYLRLVAQGKADEAAALIREKVPFPGVLGRSCFRPCEEICRRGEVDEPIAICALKRFAADHDDGSWKKAARTASDSGHRVAVIGSGPAGLTAAFYLKKSGHRVTVFESRKLPGGMLRYGIPGYRIPADVVDKEIQDILELGMELKTGKTLGRDLTLEQLIEEGYRAVFVAVGAQNTRKLEIPGAELKDVMWGVDFLCRVNEGEKVELKPRVVVIGGGNVAVDVALTALRSGAQKVTMVCLENREEMPAHQWEIAQVVEEGIEILTQWGPEKIVSEGGMVRGIELKGCASVLDRDGRFAPTYDERRKTIETDQVILAVGQAADLGFVQPGGPIKVERGVIVVDQSSLATGMLGVYAGGDVAEAPGSIITAIAAGRTAASAIDQLLGGKGEIEETLFEHRPAAASIGRIEGFAALSRQEIPQLPVAARCGNFEEVEMGYDTQQAEREALRCLQCDLRLLMHHVDAPPARWLKWSRESIEAVPATEGVYQLLGEDKKVLSIKGVINLREALLQALNEQDKVDCFEYEEAPMYSKRESELLQRHLKQHGEMPGGGADDLDDLF